MSIIKYENAMCSMDTFKRASDAAQEAEIMYDIYDAKIWLNLTNGIEAAPFLDKLKVPYDFCRFRSCSFEQKRWMDAIDSMPDDMLMRLAIGQKQVIIDFGANKPCPRAMRQGIPIAIRRLAISWELCDDMDEHLYMFSRNGKVMQCDKDFTKHTMSINKQQRNRINYFGKYANKDTGIVDITMLCAPTAYDGDYNHHVGIASNVRFGG